MRRVFISHIEEEACIARVLRDFLRREAPDGDTRGTRQKRHKPNPFLSDDLEPGDDWFLRLRRELDRSDVILVVCSRYSVEQQWINFETGYGWRDRRIIPICHTDQEIDQLRPPFTMLHGLQVGNEELPTRLAEICGKEPPPPHLVSQVNDQLRAAERSVPPIAQTIESKPERTRLITSDLKQLLRKPNLGQQKVRHSAFLSTFAVGQDDPNEPNYRSQLYEERDLLLSLAREGCMIDCLISPANQNYFIAAGLKYAITAAGQLLRFLRSSDTALEHINWAISETGLAHRFIIGDISYFEGYKTGAELSYGITRRYRAPHVIAFNTQRFDEEFEGCQRRNLVNWKDHGSDPHGPDRQHRKVAIQHLENSLRFLGQMAGGQASSFET